MKAGDYVSPFIQKPGVSASTNNSGEPNGDSQKTE